MKHTKSPPRNKSQNQPVIILGNAREHQVVIRALEKSRGQKPLALNQVIDEWVKRLRARNQARTAENTEFTLKAWMRDQNLAETPVRDLNEDHISEWINRDSGIHLDTRKRHLSTIRVLFDYLIIKDYISADPSRLVAVNHSELSHEQKEPKEVHPFTALEFDRLLKHLDGELKAGHETLANPQRSRQRAQSLIDRMRFWKPAVIISRCAGLRLGDVAQLEWKSTEGKRFAVWTDKTNKRVEPHIWNQALFDDAIGSIPMEDPQYCFPAQREVARDYKARANLSVQFIRILESAKLSALTFHSLRHTYATECQRAGIPTPHIAQSLGHSSTTTTETYLH